MPYLDNGTALDADGPLILTRVETFLMKTEKGNTLDFRIVFKFSQKLAEMGESGGKCHILTMAQR